MFKCGKEHWAAYASKSEASVLHKHESEHHQNAPAEWKMKVYNYHSKPLRRQIEEGVLINNARGGELLNSKSEMTRGGKIPRLVIMVGDKEVHNVCSERKQVEAHTHIESSPEIVPECVGRKSKMIIPGVKRQTQPLISGCFLFAGFVDILIFLTTSDISGCVCLLPPGILILLLRPTHSGTISGLDSRYNVMNKWVHYFGTPCIYTIDYIFY